MGQEKAEPVSLADTSVTISDEEAINIIKVMAVMLREFSDFDVEQIKTLLEFHYKSTSLQEVREYINAIIK